MEKGNAHRASPFLHLYDLSAKSALLTHLGKALAAIHRTIALRLEGNTGLPTAGSADSGEVLAGAAGGVLASVAAGLAALGLILEAALSVELHMLNYNEQRLLTTMK